MIEETENIKKRVVRHPDAVDLYIKRLPKQVRDIFVDFANKEFVGDYGMALKHIIHEFFIQGERINMILSVLDEHENRISELENKKPKESIAIKGIRENLRRRKEKEEKKNE